MYESRMILLFHSQLQRSSSWCAKTVRIISIVDRIITREKGFIAKLDNGELSVDPDVLVQLMVPASVASQQNPQSDLLGGLKNSDSHLDPPQGNQMRNPSESQPRYGWDETHIEQEQGGNNDSLCFCNFSLWIYYAQQGACYAEESTSQ